MSAAEGKWVKAAMTDDALVAELLVRIHAAAESPPPLRPPALPFEWSVRQRRSKHVSANNNPKKLAQRASPTTPLSWSFATSLSGGSGGAGDEESSRFTSRKPPSSAPRSKVNGECEKSVASKRTRKKKTLAELKDEESSLIKERRELKRELSAMRVNLEKQRATNENLKRLKIELQPVLDTEMTLAAEGSISGELHPTATAVVVTLQPSTSNGSTRPNPDPKFVLPDLNMPLEEDSCPDVVYARPPPPPPTTYVPV